MSRREDPPNATNHDDIGCFKAIEMLYAYLEGELESPGEVEEFERHIEHCRSCFTRAELENLLTERLKEVARQRAPERLHDRLNKLMNEF